MASTRFDELLRTLAREGVEFVLVGMLAGVLRGAPLTTRDVNIVHNRTPENIRRLLKVLGRIHATYRGDPRRLSPNETHLSGPGQQLLVTDFGDLDCLGSLHDGQTYGDLLSKSSGMQLGDNLAIRVLRLDELLLIKQKAGRPKDLAAVPVLEATLEEARRRGKQ